MFLDERSKNGWYGTGFLTFQKKAKKETDFFLIIQSGESIVFGKFRNCWRIKQLQGYSYQICSSRIKHDEPVRHGLKRLDVISNARLGKRMSTGVYLFFPAYILGNTVI